MGPSQSLAVRSEHLRGKIKIFGEEMLSFLFINAAYLPHSASDPHAGDTHGPQQPCSSGLAEHWLSQCRAAASFCAVLTHLGLCIDLLEVTQLPPNTLQQEQPWCGISLAVKLLN